MTYMKSIPDKVISRWQDLNPNFTIDCSLDADCIQFLETYFSPYIASLFQTIHPGSHKADLWRLCKLYIYGGVYADVDLVPYLDIESLDKSITFYSCLSSLSNSIFQAFIVVTPKNPFILHCLLSLLMNKVYNIFLGPTFDMYNCMKHNLHGISIMTDTPYTLDTINIPIYIGPSNTNTTYIELYYFPNDINYTIQLNPSIYPDRFAFEINGTTLSVTRLDNPEGWGFSHSCSICIPANETLYLFNEVGHADITKCIVTYKGTKILDSRDPAYINGGGW